MCVYINVYIYIYIYIFFKYSLGDLLYTLHIAEALRLKLGLYSFCNGNAGARAEALPRLRGMAAVLTAGALEGHP